MNRGLHFSPLSLAFGYVTIGIAALILFAAPLYYAWQVTIEDGRAEILREDAQRLTAVFQRSGPSGLAAFVKERVNLQIAGERILLVTDASYRPIAGNLPAWPAGIPTRAGTYAVSFDLAGHPTSVTIVRASLPGGYNLLVGRDTARFAPLQKHFWYGLAASVAILLVFGTLGGLLIQRAMLARIHSTRQAVSAIMLGDLSRRLPTRANGDELDNFSQTINRMLEQIEQLVNGIKNVSNSIAHDLRTPLAELRSRLEELLLNRPSPDEAFEEIEAAVSDVDGVIAMFNALLRLAEIDSGLRRSGFVQIDTATMAAEVAEFYVPAAELQDTVLSCVESPPIYISGDRLLLTQAISNLIENSLKYVASGGSVQVQAAQRADGFVCITVSDNGPGISDAEKPKVAQRFYRGDVSRSTPGVGLGLSLVEAVARLHGGTLEFFDNHPGLRAQITVAPAPPELANDVHDAMPVGISASNRSAATPHVTQPSLSSGLRR